MSDLAERTDCGEEGQAGEWMRCDSARRHAVNAEAAFQHLIDFWDELERSQQTTAMRNIVARSGSRIDNLLIRLTISLAESSRDEALPVEMTPS